MLLGFCAGIMKIASVFLESDVHNVVIGDVDDGDNQDADDEI